MKYTQYSAFERHISDAGDHLSDLYYLIDVDETFLEFIAQKIAPRGKKIRFEEADLYWNTQIPPLDPAESYLILTQVQKVSPDQKRCLLDKHPLKKIILLASEGDKELIREIEKKGIVLDLSFEKPWDRENLFKSLVQKKLLEDKISLSYPMAEKLVKQVGRSFSDLLNEVEKLALYLQGKAAVTHKDLEVLLPETPNSTLWALTGAILEKKGALALQLFHSLPDPTLLPLLYALRSTFKKSALLIALHEEKLSLDEIAKRVGLSPKYVEKQLALALSYHHDRLLKALTRLYDFELDLKSKTFPEKEAFETLLLQLSSCEP